MVELGDLVGFWRNKVGMFVGKMSQTEFDEFHRTVIGEVSIDAVFARLDFIDDPLCTLSLILTPDGFIFVRGFDDLRVLAMYEDALG